MNSALKGVPQRNLCLPGESSSALQMPQVPHLSQQVP